MSARIVPLLPVMYEELVRAALREDLGRAGDLTTDAIVGPGSRSRARIVARQPGRVAGIEIALCAFRLLDPEVHAAVVRADGTDVKAGGTIVELAGSSRTLLTGERTALNLLGRLCGIATATRELVARLAGTRTRVCETRKTTPGLRALEKYAVRCGGGANHRFGLDDAVLIKDNHLVAAGGVTTAVAAVRAYVGHLVKIEVEVDALEQLREALACGVDVVLLDNMSPARLREAVALIAGRAIVEASGTISRENIAEVAASGVDLISVGALTHSAPVLDLGLDFL